MADLPFVEGIPLTKPSRACALLAQFLAVWALNLLVCLALLHGAFVGSPGCIGAALTDLASSVNGTTALPVAPALAGQQPQPPQRWLVGQRQKRQPPEAAPPPPPPLLGMEDVLQVKIVTDRPSATKGWSFNLPNLFPGLDGADAYAAAAAAGVPPSGSTGGSTSGGKGNGTAKSGGGVFEPHYVFTQNAPLLYLDAGFLARHAVRRVNVSVDEACLSKGYGGLLRFLCGEPERAGLDTVVINQLMAALRSDGFLRVGAIVQCLAAQTPPQKKKGSLTKHTHTHTRPHRRTPRPTRPGAGAPPNCPQPPAAAGPPPSGSSWPWCCKAPSPSSSPPPPPPSSSASS